MKKGCSDGFFDVCRINVIFFFQTLLHDFLLNHIGPPQFKCRLLILNEFLAYNALNILGNVVFLVSHNFLALTFEKQAKVNQPTIIRPKTQANLIFEILGLFISNNYVNIN